MAIKVKDLGKNQVEFSVSIDAEKFSEATQKAYIKNVKKIMIPGFRKGKAPRFMIERMYGEGVFFEDAINDLLPEAYEKALEETKLDVVSQPDISIDDVSKEKGFTFTAKVYVRPVVEVKNYKGITAKKVVYTVKDEQLSAQLESLRERNSRMITVEDRGIEKDDIATINYKGFVDGKEFKGGSAENHDLTIGSGQFIPGFEDQLIGKGTNDDVKVNVTFPEDYHAEELKGKEAQFDVKIVKVSKKELPELDDDFAKDVSEFDTMEEYKADMKAKMQKQLDERADAEFENSVIAEISKTVEVEIPDAMIEDRVNYIAREQETSMMQQGISREMYLKFTGMDEAAYLSQFKPMAEAQVKSLLVLNAVAKAEKIEATDDDINAEVEKISEQYGVEKDKVLSMIPRTELEKDIIVKKAVDFVKDNAVCQEISEEEYLKEKEAEAKAAKEEKPAKKTTTKKTTTKKAADKEEVKEEKPAKKTTTRKTATKKAADNEEAKEEKPAKKTTTRKKKTEEEK